MSQYTIKKQKNKKQKTMNTIRRISKQSDLVKSTELYDVTHVKKIIFDDEFNDPISTLSQFVNLKSITFGHNFNQSITSLAELKKLKVINFGHHFDQSITSLAELKKLKVITFGHNFNRSITSLAELKKLKVINFGHNFDQSIAPLAKVKNLREIHFGYVFKQELYYLDELHHLRLVTFRKFPYSKFNVQNVLTKFYLRGKFRKNVIDITGLMQCISSYILEGEIYLYNTTVIIEFIFNSRVYRDTSYHENKVFVTYIKNKEIINKREIASVGNELGLDILNFLSNADIPNIKKAR